MKCPACGAENRINSLYCDECGAEIEHDVSQVQASVDAEIRDERRKAAAQSVRWLLGVAFVVFIAALYFRRAYRDLPANDIVAFVTAPTVELGELKTVGTTDFGVPLPPPARVGGQPRHRYDPAVARQLADAAHQSALVAVQHTRSKNPVHGLLVGDLVLYIPVPGQKEPKPVHIVDVRSLRPAGGRLWEIGAKGLEKPVQAPIPDVETTRLRVLHKAPDGKMTTDVIPLASLLEIKPL